MRQRFVNLSIDPSVSNISGEIPPDHGNYAYSGLSIPIIIPSLPVVLIVLDGWKNNVGHWQRWFIIVEGGQSTPCNLAVGRGHSPGGVINNRPGVLRRALLLFDTPYNSLICTTVLSARLCTEITEAEKKKLSTALPVYRRHWKVWRRRGRWFHGAVFQLIT